MPAEGRKKHPHIHPRDSHPADFFFITLSYPQNGGGGLVNVIEVVKGSYIIEKSIGCVLSVVKRKSTAVPVRGKICCIFHCCLNLPSLILALRSHCAPILILSLRFKGMTYSWKLKLVPFCKILSVFSERLYSVLLFLFIKSLNYEIEI